MLGAALPTLTCVSQQTSTHSSPGTLMQTHLMAVALEAALELDTTEIPCESVLGKEQTRVGSATSQHKGKHTGKVEYRFISTTHGRKKGSFHGHNPDYLTSSLNSPTE